MDDENYYYLHPDLVENNVVTLCKTCFIVIKKDSVPKSIPLLSIASGIHFGNPDRIGLPALSLVEELLIAQSRMYVYLLLQVIYPLLLFNCLHPHGRF